MRFWLERVSDGNYIGEHRVYANDEYVGFVAWRHDHPQEAWYFHANLKLGLDVDGGVYFWWLAYGEESEHIAICKFKRKFYATFKDVIP